MRTPFSKILLVALLVAAPALLLAGQGKDDAHWNGDSAAPLYHVSVFAHGFIHGYEDGFRIADEIYQLGMAPVSFNSYPQYKDATSHYDSSFGPKDRFKAGYREGFMTAYREGFGPNAPRYGAAYREGQARGLSEGREAGREDAQRNHWDLEGQRELVLADSGYRQELGSRSEYEEGYRAGFRQGYSEGFGRR